MRKLMFGVWAAVMAVGGCIHVSGDRVPLKPPPGKQIEELTVTFEQPDARDTKQLFVCGELPDAGFTCLDYGFFVQSLKEQQSEGGERL